MIEIQDRTDRQPAGVDLIGAQLERILSSRHFKNSRRCQALLRYVVDTFLNGNPDELKERVVGTVVFGRDPGYDTNEDAVVRNAAAEVRKRLAQYYLEPEHETEMRIELPPGSYVPDFRCAPVRAPERQTSAKTTSFQWWYGAVLLLIIVFTAVPVLRRPVSGSSPPSDLDRFWSPIIATPGIVQLCVGQTGLYYYDGKPPLTAANGVDAKAMIPAANLAPLRDRFMYFGDAICLGRLGGYLYSKGKEYNVRGAATTPYSELRGHPVVLIGAFNNAWTLRLSEGLRFSLGQSSDPQTRTVLDRQNPGSTPWKVAKMSGTWNGEEDYAIVTRIFDPNTERWVVAAGGISHFGTMMAGDFLANASYFSKALASAPKDWPQKNMQIVLETKIVGGTPGPPEVLATHFW